MPLLKLSDQAMKNGNYALSVEAATAADKACRIANDAPMAAFVKEQLAEATQVLTAFETAKSSLEKLASAPEDSDANMAAGKFLCFARNQWDIGLPLLAKGSDSAIKALVQLDLAAGTDTAAQTKAAEGWWELAQSQSGITKRGLLRRSGYWYARVVPTLTGLARPQAQKRSDEAVTAGRQGMAKAIDLLPLIDPPLDTVNGKWESQNGVLVSDAARCARIEAPYEPPLEYDFRIEFTRTKGNECNVQYVAANNASFIWVMAAWGNSVFGFEMVGGKQCNDNRTTVRAKKCLETNHRYTSLVQVRKGSVRAYVDGKLMSEWKTDFKDMSLDSYWKMRNSNVLAVGSWETPTIFHSAVVIELSGAGKKTR